MDSSQKKGLRRKIVSAMVLLALLPILVGLFVTSWKGTSELRKAIGNNFEGLAKEAANKTDLAIQKEISGLRYLGSANDIQEALLDVRSKSFPPSRFAEKTSLLPGLSERKVLSMLNRTLHLPEYGSHLRALTLTNNVGLQVAATSLNPSQQTAFWGEETWWKEAAQGEREAVFLGGIYAVDADKREYLFDLAVPVFQNETGAFLGVLKASYDMEPFLKPFIHGIRFGTTGHAMLIDSSGVVLICPILPTGSHVADPQLMEQVASRSPGWITAKSDGHGGVNSIVGFAPVEAVNRLISTNGGKQWYSFIRQEPKETYAPLQSLLGAVLISGSLLIGLTCVLGFMVSGKLVQPLLLLRQGAEQIRKGDLSFRLRIKTNDEIEAVADKFNEMAQELSEFYTTLEHKVTARTRELQALNQIATTVNQSLELQGILDSTLEKMFEVTPFESGYIELIDRENRRLALKNHRGFSDDIV
ncbi:MAG TPA: cache domain-containing protein, partial [Candidatus Manganitrophaceae bacterium]